MMKRKGIDDGHIIMISSMSGHRVPPNPSTRQVDTQCVPVTRTLHHDKLYVWPQESFLPIHQASRYTVCPNDGHIIMISSMFGHRNPSYPSTRKVDTQCVPVTRTHHHDKPYAWAQESFLPIHHASRCTVHPSD